MRAKVASRSLATKMQAVHHNQNNHTLWYTLSLGGAWVHELAHDLVNLERSSNRCFSAPPMGEVCYSSECTSKHQHEKVERHFVPESEDVPLETVRT